MASVSKDPLNAEFLFGPWEAEPRFKGSPRTVCARTPVRVHTLSGNFHIVDDCKAFFYDFLTLDP